MFLTKYIIRFKGGKGKGKRDRKKEKIGEQPACSTKTSETNSHFFFFPFTFWDQMMFLRERENKEFEKNEGEKNA